ncbi:hypothetical protein [Ralstonia mannitolilytica]|uniref:hypothetical protein n=1 Tax=Ralstonia mannitolilytica TaxID=105219 RepID=UPI000CEF4379|nr:hypothetical protein [Ralstonia mannitolilytica]
MDFENRIKKEMTEGIVKAILEDAGYRVIDSGIEKIIRELSCMSSFEYAKLPNATDGLMHVQINDGTAAAPVWNDFGIMSFQAGDRGPVLTIDRFGNNQDTPPVMRTGAIYASKLQTLAQTVVNGFLACQDGGKPFANLQINGPQVLLADNNGNYQPYAQLFYNNISTGKGLYEVEGIATMVVGNQLVGSGALFLPLSSSLTVFEREATQTVAVCR